MDRRRSFDSELHPIPTLERLCGAEVAGRFLDAFAGLEMLIPKISAPARIVKVIGIEATKALMKECGGCKYQIPSNRDRRAIAMFQDGRTVAEVAAALSITQRAVYLMRSRLGITGRAPKSSSKNGVFQC